MVAMPIPPCDAPELQRTLGEVLARMSHRRHLGQVAERLLEGIVNAERGLDVVFRDEVRDPIDVAQRARGVRR